MEITKPTSASTSKQAGHGIPPIKPSTPLFLLPPSKPVVLVPTKNELVRELQGLVGTAVDGDVGPKLGPRLTRTGWVVPTVSTHHLLLVSTTMRTLFRGFNVG